MQRACTAVASWRIQTSQFTVIDHLLVCYCLYAEHIELLVLPRANQSRVTCTTEVQTGGSFEPHADWSTTRDGVASFAHVVNLYMTSITQRAVQLARQSEHLGETGPEM